MSTVNTGSAQTLPSAQNRIKLGTSPMNKALDYANALLTINRLLFLHWGLFWFFNGLDKFFNGQWFGVTRNEKMIGYFGSLALPAEMALTFLYGIAVVEIILGFVFLLALVYPALSENVRHLLFKCSIMIFMMFSVGDIFFGDRVELWEHGTFMILALISCIYYIHQTSKADQTTKNLGPSRWPTPPLRSPSLSKSNQ